MLSEDYEEGHGRRGSSRLQAIKPVIQAFIDRHGPPTGSASSSSRRRPTRSRPSRWTTCGSQEQIERVKIGLIRDGTAIGDALGVALTRLDQPEREVGGKRKGAFIVLLTDGANNMGSDQSPKQSAQLAKARGVPIYTIGAGKDGLVPYPNFDENGKKVSYAAGSPPTWTRTRCATSPRRPGAGSPAGPPTPTRSSRRSSP